MRAPGPAPWFAALAAPWARWWFRTRIVGRERLPDGPVVLAAVHSALGIADALVLSWVGASFGPRRRFVGSGHRLLIGRYPLLTKLYSSMGGVPGNRETLEALLRSGTSVVSFPGGVHDVTRPVWRWAEPDWAGRAGFVRVAASVGVPVVPLVIHGAGWTYWVLGVLRFPAFVRRWLAEPLAGVALTPTVLAAATVTGLAAAGTVTWGWAALAWLAAALPLPVRLTVEALEPVDPGGGTSEEVAERVRMAIETALRRGAPGQGPACASPRVTSRGHRDTRLR